MTLPNCFRIPERHPELRIPRSTPDPDTEALVRKRMSERGVSFEQALNEAIREGLARPGRKEEVPDLYCRSGAADSQPRPGPAACRGARDEELVRKARSGK